MYQFDVVWRSKQQSIVPSTIRPYVVIGNQSHEMEPTKLVRDRWETLVPVPEDQKMVNFHYKFDYQYRGFPARQSNSKLSRPYQLRIVD